MTVPPDPRTQAALDRVRADLAALPDLTMPPDVAERIGRALAAAGDDRPDDLPTDADRAGNDRIETGRIETGRTRHGPAEVERTGNAPVGMGRNGHGGAGNRDGSSGSTPVRRATGRVPRGGPAPRRPAGRRRTVRTVLGVAVPAGVAAAALAVLLVPGPTGPAPVSRADDLRSAGAAAFGPDGAGPLADPARRRGCLTTAGVPEPGATLLGGVRHDVDGRPGTLLVLGTGTVGRYRLVVVDTGCGPSGGRVLAQTVAGR